MRRDSERAKAVIRALLGLPQVGSKIKVVSKGRLYYGTVLTVTEVYGESVHAHGNRNEIPLFYSKGEYEIVS